MEHVGRRLLLQTSLGMPQQYLRHNIFLRDIPMSQIYKSPDPNGDMENVSTVEYWLVENTGTASNADISLYWDSRTFSGIQDASNLVVAHYNTTDSEWENFGQDAVLDADPGFVRADNVSTFSPFTLGSLMGNSLPVELLYFSHEKQGVNVILEWATALEIDNSHFEIQKSANGEFFETIGRVEGQGNSERKHEYTYRDTSPYLGVGYYRLKQVDFDNTFEYSDIIRVESDFAGYQLFPNPVNGDYVNLRIPAGEQGMVHVTLLNLIGQPVAEYSYLGASREIIEVQINVGTITKGVYLMQIVTEDQRITERVVIPE